MSDNITPIFERFSTKPKKFLHHYTGVGTLLSMLRKNTPEFWLSDIAYLNDSQELLYAHKLMKRLLEDPEYTKNINQDALPFLSFFCDLLGVKKNIHAHLYVMSFSEAPDNLNQWRSYTPHGKGLHLTFNFKNPDIFLSEKKLLLAECEYDKERQIDLVNRLIIYIEESFSKIFKGTTWPTGQSDLNMTQDISNHFNHTLNLSYKIFSIIKHPAFEDEKEWRLIYQPSVYNADEIDFREGSSMLIPFIKVKIDLIQYLDSIKIGPTEHKDLSLEAILGLLKKYNMSKIGTSYSKIPYREW